MKHFSTDNVDEWASKCAVKVKLTEAQNYDVIAFKHKQLYNAFCNIFSTIKNTSHRGGGVSCVETLSDYWVERYTHLISP